MCLASKLKWIKYTTISLYQLIQFRRPMKIAFKSKPFFCYFPFPFVFFFLYLIKYFFSLFFTQGPPQPNQPYKFTILENCDRIKEEFNFLQTQYHRCVHIYISFLLFFLFHSHLHFILFFCWKGNLHLREVKKN